MASFVGVGGLALGLGDSCVAGAQLNGQKGLETGTPTAELTTETGGYPPSDACSQEAKTSVSQEGLELT